MLGLMLSILFLIGGLFWGVLIYFANMMSDNPSAHESYRSAIVWIMLASGLIWYNS